MVKRAGFEMKIFTHWVYDPDEECHTKDFFGTKSERDTASKKLRNEGKRVIAQFEWPVEPTAKDFASFCREHLKLREYKKYPEDDDDEVDQETLDML